MTADRMAQLAEFLKAFNTLCGMYSFKITADHDSSYLRVVDIADGQNLDVLGSSVHLEWRDETQYTLEGY